MGQDEFRVRVAGHRPASQLARQGGSSQALTSGGPPPSAPDRGGDGQDVSHTPSEDSGPASVPEWESRVAPCEFRQRTPEGEVVCVASGGRTLREMAGPDRSPADVCQACPIPSELARRPCLYQVPLKVWRGGTWVHVFPCRFFWSLQAHSSFPCTTLDWCMGCPYWFPRPDSWPSPHDYLCRTRQMAEDFQAALDSPPAPPRRWEPPPPAVPLWRRVWQWLGPRRRLPR